MIQFLRLINFHEPTIMVSQRDSFYSTDKEFTSDEGLSLAFGITAYDDNQEPIEEAQYGHLKAYYKSWGVHEHISGIHFEELPTRQCTRAQLGLP